MKKGIEAYSDYDQNWRWRLVIEKKRGKLTLDEIREAAREWEYDFYLLVLDCFHDESDYQLYGDDSVPVGDRAVLYRTEKATPVLHDVECCRRKFYQTRPDEMEVED